MSFPTSFSSCLFALHRCPLLDLYEPFHLLAGELSFMEQCPTRGLACGFILAVT